MRRRARRRGIKAHDAVTAAKSVFAAAGASTVDFLHAVLMVPSTRRGTRWHFVGWLRTGCKVTSQRYGVERGLVNRPNTGDATERNCSRAHTVIVPALRDDLDDCTVKSDRPVMLKLALTFKVGSTAQGGPTASDGRGG